MGTDIHAVIEYRRLDYSWAALSVPNPYFGRYDDEPRYRYRLHIERDYNLFAILAGVRNGSGFAGVDIGDGFDPIAADRGFPDDMTTEARASVSNEHSATWIFLSEILAYDWTRTSKLRGVVGAKEFERWDRVRGFRPWPDEWRGSISGPDIKNISNDDMRKIIALIVGEKRRGAHEVAIDSLPGNLYTTIEWEVSYADAGKAIWTHVLPEMLKLGTQFGNCNVRLVMDFDS